MPQRPLPLNAIHAFIVAARHLNLTHAASELCITQGAVSRKIAALEAWLGFTLFDRHARGLHLTPQGASLLPALQSGYQQMHDAAQQASRQHAVIRLKAPTCAMRWLVPKLVALEKQRPELHVSLTTTVEHSGQLENFDAAIVYGSMPRHGVLLFEEALTPVMAAALLPEPAVTPASLAAMTFLHPTADSRDWQLWLQANRQPPLMKRNQHFATMDLAISAAIQGFGVTVADVTLIAEDLAMQRLVAPFSGSVKTGAVYSLLRRPPEEAPPLLDELVAWLSEGN
ncbi:Glycine cleavage system transcriptional activator [Erwinia aphidicola]|uniref:LysR substrate-binding domain-containing protein n=1 Tax=Erwinia aphidicola TaxID=68334 RepID=UPI000C1A695F|nr:LysR substrate-binding domain-containing protein [Erwinia aphidicola]PIJ58364.1 LysR family transcriptional regulator [Erwinia sp. OLMDLW33]CAH0143974.1 Glycine cleavage system transcriptional activator [Erwinia aphidicola]